VGFKLTTLVVIGTDCISSDKSNYHTITTASIWAIISVGTLHFGILDITLFNSPSNLSSKSETFHKYNLMSNHSQGIKFHRPAQIIKFMNLKE
jgi:hypothetical protein